MYSLNLKRIFFIIVIALVFINTYSQVGKFKSAYIFNFTRYLEWPTSYNGNEFVIGIFGNDREIINELKIVSDAKTVAGKPIRVVTYTSLQEIGSCNILFICMDKSSQLKSVIEKTKSDNVLIVTDKPGAINDGSAINFLINDNRLAFELSSSNAQARGLKVSNTLESLAIKMH